MPCIDLDTLNSQLKQNSLESLTLDPTTINVINVVSRTLRLEDATGIAGIKALSSEHIIVTTKAGELEVWDIENNIRVNKLTTTAKNGVRNFYPYDEISVLSGVGGSIEKLDVRKGICLEKLPGHKHKHPTSVIERLGDDCIITGSIKDTVLQKSSIHVITLGQDVKSYAIKNVGATHWLIGLPNQRFLAHTSRLGLSLWDASNGRPERSANELPFTDSHRVFKLSPDRLLGVSANGQQKIVVETERLTPIIALTANEFSLLHRSYTDAVLLHNDLIMTRYETSSGQSGYLELWSLSSGQRLFKRTEEKRCLTSCHNGSILVSANSDNTLSIDLVQLRELSPPNIEKLITHLKENTSLTELKIARISLTPSQWDTIYAHIGLNRQLERLSLDYTGISAEQINTIRERLEIMPSSQLKQVSIAGHRLTAEELEGFSQFLRAKDIRLISTNNTPSQLSASHNSQTVNTVRTERSSPGTMSRSSNHNTLHPPTSAFNESSSGEFSDQVGRSSSDNHDHGTFLQLNASPLTEKTSQQAKRMGIDHHLVLNPTQLSHQRNEVGKGGYATVYAGSYNGVPVAIKEFNWDNRRENTLTSFTREAEIMAKVSGHNYIAKFGGVIVEEPVKIIIEYYPYGSLEEVLRSNIEFNWATKMSWVYEIAQAVADLHQNNILHGDLKSGNILVANDGSTRLSDFGLSIDCNNSSRAWTPRSQFIGTTEWMAPELLENMRKIRRDGEEPFAYSTACDMYSLGMLFWEIGTRKTPWSKQGTCLVDRQTVDHRVIRGEREQIPADFPSELRQIITQCWDKNPQTRPSASQIVDQLVENNHVKSGRAMDSIIQLGLFSRKKRADMPYFIDQQTFAHQNGPEEEYSYQYDSNRPSSG